MWREQSKQPGKGLLVERTVASVTKLVMVINDAYLAHRQAVPAPPPSRPAINLSSDKILVHGYHMDNVKILSRNRY